MGDCASQILSRISTGVFSPGYLLGSDEARREQMAEDRAAALSWWRDVQENGEARVLTEAIAAAQVETSRMQDPSRGRSISFRQPNLSDLEKRLKEIQPAGGDLPETKKPASEAPPE